jgi:hypothetical protein
MLTYILAVLATYRVARMLALEEGPFSVFDRWRNLFLKDDWIGRGMRCPLCLGFWLALPAAVAALLFDRTLPADAALLVWLGIAGGQAVLWDWTNDA